MEATRQAGMERLAAFVRSGAQAYGKSRNFDLGPTTRHNVSQLSPYIRHRLLTEEEVLRATLDQHSRSSTAKFVEEVLWRAYFKGWLEHHPTVWQAYREDVSAWIDRLETDSSLHDRYSSAIEGRTGIDCFDAWVDELTSTGYLHNHARMWFASIWVFTLQLPWQMGADFFYRHLLDGDAAANTLSWRWVSGLHTKGKTYLARVSNIVNFTDGRFNPQGQLATEAAPREESRQHATTRLTLPTTRIPESRFGLLLIDDDLQAADLLGEAKPVAVLGLSGTQGRSPLPIGQRAFDFTSDAIKSATRTTAANLSVSGKFVAAQHWGETLLEWSAQNDCNTIVVARPTIGPLREAFDDARTYLRKERVDVVELVRQYDRVTWPHASRGYFRLKKQISDILSNLALEGDGRTKGGQISRPHQRDLLDEAI